jgi:hypothetical protein
MNYDKDLRSLQYSYAIFVSPLFIGSMAQFGLVFLSYGSSQVKHISMSFPYFKGIKDLPSFNTFKTTITDSSFPSKSEHQIKSPFVEISVQIQ